MTFTTMIWLCAGSCWTNCFSAHRPPSRTEGLVGAEMLDRLWRTARRCAG